MTHVDTKRVTLSVAGDSRRKRLMTHKKKKKKKTITSQVKNKYLSTKVNVQKEEGICKQKDEKKS